MTKVKKIRLDAPDTVPRIVPNETSKPAFPPTLINRQANRQRYTYRALQTIQMKLILLCVWAEPAVLGSTKTALKFIYKI